VQARIGKLRPKLALADTLLQLWRARWLMLLVIAPVALAALAVVLLSPPQYVASARLLVQPGQSPDVLQAEAELARAPVLAERTIRAVGLSRLYPLLAEAGLRSRGGEGDVIGQEARDAFAASLQATTAPGSSILHLTFRHEEPALAAETLSRLLAAYLVYRREVFAGEGAQTFSDQRKQVEARLAAADQALRDYSARNGLADFDAESAAVAHLFADIADERARVQATLREAQARTEGLARQLSAMPRQVDLHVETTSEQQLLDLRLQRETLLARYLPDSRVVKDIERRIAQVETYLASAPVQGVRRIGPNPVWQALETERAAEAATVLALNARLAGLAGQQADVEARMARLDQLRPDYLRLKRGRDALEASAAALAAREQDERASVELAARGIDTVSIYEAARPPVRADDGWFAFVFAGVILGLVAALLVGLLRARTIAGLPTAASVERTLGLPVLATTRER